MGQTRRRKKWRKRQLDGTVMHQPFGKKCGCGRPVSSIIIVVVGPRPATDALFDTHSVVSDSIGVFAELDCQVEGKRRCVEGGAMEEYVWGCRMRLRRDGILTEAVFGGE